MILEWKQAICAAAMLNKKNELTINIKNFCKMNHFPHNCGAIPVNVCKSKRNLSFLKRHKVEL
jgi:hypothetical protein